MEDFTLADYKFILKAKNFANNLHDNRVNQMYDKKLGLPYSYHLDMVVDFIKTFSYLLDSNEEIVYAIAGGYVHDSVEDGRQTFNDIKKVLGEIVARLSCNLCCDVWGENRSERNSIGYYKRLNKHKLSVFIKLCDRMANIMHGLIYGSSMVKTYMSEMDTFLSKLDYKEEFKQMRTYLKNMDKIYGV